MRATGRAAAALLLLSALGCSSLRPGTPPPRLYALDALQAVVAPIPGEGQSRRTRPAASRLDTRDEGDGAPTLVINPPRAAAGYDSQRLIYLRQPHELEYFARSQWVDTPARMLQPLIAAAIERSGRFRAVLQMPVGATGDFRLETDLVRLQQEFLSRPSRVHLTLRATLSDTATRRVVAWREFDAAVPAASDDPYGGVVAANQAVREVLEQLAAFCAAATGDRSTDPAGARP